MVSCIGWTTNLVDMTTLLVAQASSKVVSEVAGMSCDPEGKEVVAATLPEDTVDYAAGVKVLLSKSSRTLKESYSKIRQYVWVVPQHHNQLPAVQSLIALSMCTMYTKDTPSGSLLCATLPLAADMNGTDEVAPEVASQVDSTQLEACPPICELLDGDRALFSLA
eukprot:6003992-Amphidinium_carterae.1